MTKPNPPANLGELLRQIAGTVSIATIKHDDACPSLTSHSLLDCTCKVIGIELGKIETKHE